MTVYSRLTMLTANVNTPPKSYLLALLMLAVMTLQGCVVAVGAAGAMAAKVANDRRTVGAQLDDQNASSAVAYQWSGNETLKEQANLQVDIYNGVALLTGQVPAQPLVAEAVSLAKKVEYVRKIHNQIRVAEPLSASRQAKDIWIASKVRAKLLADERIPAMQVKVIVQNSEVFLMGRLSNQEATAAVDVARNVEGVSKVIRALEIMQ
ncbi:BON domain-containing protein [Alteromonas halophila]|uniref:BON domain-containing protein n=1 Tax=Alteromonas halophila TaxID=516698 RepID=A0A918N205_9ALTE|nr:BON domain-containing protein [Alteromonas halophila]GGW96916.1 BON domain-containing protein [Alteromonas halophila]